MEQNSKEYWGSLEELNSTPAVTEALTHEFTKDAVGGETLSPMERRDFLKVMGASLLMATAACSRKPVEKLIPYTNKPESVIPGVSSWYASTCFECSANCGILIKSKEGRPIKLEGNEQHPLNQGTLCARGQASLLNVYYPDRIKTPLFKNTETTWEVLDAAVADSVASSGEVALLTRVITGPASRQIISDFTDKFPSARHVAYESAVPEEISLASGVCYDDVTTPSYRFDKASLILSLGADFLGTWLSPVEFSKYFSKARKVDGGSMARFIAVDSSASLTGTNADQHIAVKPGDEIWVALGLAHEILLNLKAGSADSALLAALKSFSPESVAQMTGVTAETIQKIAAELVQAKGKSLVVGGGVKNKNAIAIQVAANIINSALGNDGATVDYSSPSLQADSSFAKLITLIDDMKAGKIATLIINDANPVYDLPVSLGFAEALKNVKTVVVSSQEKNETTALAHYVAPASHFLESWGDASPHQGLYSVGQPAITPLYDSRSLSESLLKWMGSDVSWLDYIKDHWKNKVLTGLTGNFEFSWMGILQKGVLDTRSNASGRAAPARSVMGRAASLLPVVPAAKATDSFTLGMYPSVGLYDGRSASNAWLQELPDPVSKVVWDNHLSLSPQAAKDQGLTQGMVVRVTGEGIDFEAPVQIQPRLHDKACTIAVGYGRKVVGSGDYDLEYNGGDLGNVGQNIGVNVRDSQGIDKLLVWSGAPVTIAKTGKRHVLAATQIQHQIEKRPLIKDATFAEFQKSPNAGNEEHESFESLWPSYKYEGHRWAMAIDLTSCTGCSACMIGCQSENNIPVVGKEQVVKGRDMHWIRIDRYYKGEETDPEVAYQPMLCQHCENAPCETVCPVLATVHNDEGLNTMNYNRCVGTRYCANNCPYKVRRFNFFNYAEQFKEPLNMVLNPDLSVRSQGVMEKCTFCQQRIVEAKDHAKDLGRPVQDGEVRTACQQTCPTDSIVFGDINDPKSKVAQLAKSERGYRVMEFLNVRPQVTYLTKIRNKDA